MKKSEIYRLAQQAVIFSPHIQISEKPEILRELIDKEDVALFVEEQEEKKKAEVANNA
jgi:hypothetical protein